MNYFQMTKESLSTEKCRLEKEYKEIKSRGLSLDLSRGKPGKEQLDLMNDMLTRKRNGYRLAVYGFTGVTVALYALFYPALIGLYTPLWYNDILLRWLPSWPI